MPLEQYAPLLAVAACLAISLIAVMILFSRLRQMEKALRVRITEGERRNRDTQAQLVQSINSVTQLTATTTASAEQRMNALGDRIDARLDQMNRKTDQRLLEMQQSMNDQLGVQLEKRLGHSFQQVSSQLEQVYKGLGEMQSLASGVGDLKKVLSGVKTRGIWGEVQLGALLEQQLTPSQYLVNAQIVPSSQERVEFAISLPGRDGEGLLLPIDSKFPIESFRRLIEASESGDRERTDKAGAELSRAVMEQGRRISEKYVKPPLTTDFGLMFLPIESLYAEVLRRPGLAESLQEKYRVIPVGPSTLSALLCSLQMGFRTVSIEQRTGEVWQLLGNVRADFHSFGEALERMRQRLDQATGELDSAAKKSRAITRQLDALDKNEPT